MDLREQHMAKSERGLPPDPFDPYLRLALANKFDTPFRRRGSVGLLIQWKSSESAREAARALPSDASLPPIYLKPRGKPPRLLPFWAMTVPIKSLNKFLDAVSDLAVKIELAAPTIPSPLA